MCSGNCGKKGLGFWWGHWFPPTCDYHDSSGDSDKICYELLQRSHLCYPTTLPRLLNTEMFAAHLSGANYAVSHNVNTPTVDSRCTTCDPALLYWCLPGPLAPFCCFQSSLEITVSCVVLRYVPPVTFWKFAAATCYYSQLTCCWITVVMGDKSSSSSESYEIDDRCASVCLFDDMGRAAARSDQKINPQLLQVSARFHQCKRRALWTYTVKRSSELSH